MSDLLAGAQQLGAFLCAHGAFEAGDLCDPNDKELLDTLSQTYVCVSPGTAIPISTTSRRNLTSLSELLSIVIEQHVRTSSSAEHLLALGFRLPDIRMQEREGLSCHQNMDNFFPNSLVDVFRADAWDRLLQRCDINT